MGLIRVVNSSQTPSLPADPSAGHIWAHGTGSSMFYATCPDSEGRCGGSGVTLGDSSDKLEKNL